MTANDDPNAVKATRTAHEIVETIRRRGGAGVTTIAKATGLSTSGVHKHLKTLAALGYVEKEGATYHVGLRYLEFGAHARARNDVYRFARPEIHRLNRSTGNLAMLAVRDEAECVYLYVVPDLEEDVSALEGTHAGLDACVPGSAIRAFTAAVTDDGVDAEERERLERIRERRLAIGPMIGEPEYRTAAVPLLDGDVPVGAVAVAGPSDRGHYDQIEQHTSGTLQDVAQRIEQRIRDARE